MLSLKRLTWIVLITLGINFIFISINLREIARKEVLVENTQYHMQSMVESDLQDVGQPFQFVLVTSSKANKIFQNLSYLFDNWKVSYETTQLLEEYDESYQKIYIFCDDQLLPNTGLEQITTYVKSGGKVVLAAGIAEGNKESYLFPMLGIVEKANKLASSRLQLADDFLPFQESEMKYDGFNASTWIKLQDTANVYVSNAETGEPVVYSYPYGRGSALVVNGTLLEDKSCLGLFVGLLSNEIEGFSYPVMNAETVFLDNFPVVTYVKDEVSMKLFGRKTDDFVENVVWPEFLRIAFRNELKYTSSVLTMGKGETYFKNIEDSLFYTMGNSALKYGGELIGAADYSHEGDFILNHNFYENFERFFPQYRMYSLAIMNGKYIAENNKQEDIKVIRGYKYGDQDTMFITDMGLEDGVYHYPVITEGLMLDDGNLFKIAMEVATNGTFSHRIDINTMICDEQENNVWDEAKYLLSDLEEKVISKISWMDSVTLSETANLMEGYFNLKYDYQVKEDHITIQSELFRPGQCFYINTKKEITNAKGAEYKKINSRYYLVRILEPVVTLELTK